MTGFAVIHPGLEHVVVAELAAAGVQAEQIPGGARFACDAAGIAKLAHTLRTPSQLLLEVGSGPARTPEMLSVLVRKMPWRSLLHPQAEVQASVSARGSALRFKDAAARNVTTAIRDAMKGPFVPDRTLRPRVPQQVQVRIVDDQVTVSLDAGGELLHRRGWRTEAGKAPLRENLAACLLALAGWKGEDALLDPFCGAGTIPIEASLLSLDRSPFGRRLFACDEWVLPVVKRGKGAEDAGNLGGRGGPGSGGARGAAGGRGAVGKRGAPVRPGSRPEGDGTHRKPAPLPVSISGSDHHAPTVITAQENARRAGVATMFRHLELTDIVPPASTGTIVTNPPYGERLGERVGGVYVTFGRVLRERFGGWRVLFLTTTSDLAAKVDRRAERIAHFKNGGLLVGAYALDL